jgi:subtilisin family serine protease
MDIAAPGNFDIASAMSKDRDADGIPGPDFPLGSYRFFGGTSAAGPHVAAASALLLQWDNTLTHAQIKTMLQQNARTDAFTGVTPNDEWGHGKLDVLAVVNEPPVCNANGPYTAECAGATTTISLDGTGSSDPNTSSGDE